MKDCSCTLQLQEHSEAFLIHNTMTVLGSWTLTSWHRSHHVLIVRFPETYESGFGYKRGELIFLCALLLRLSGHNLSVIYAVNHCQKVCVLRGYFGPFTAMYPLFETYNVSHYCSQRGPQNVVNFSRTYSSTLIKSTVIVDNWIWVEVFRVV